MIPVSPRVKLLVGEPDRRSIILHPNEYTAAVPAIRHCQNGADEFSELLPLGSRTRALEFKACTFAGSYEFKKLLVSHVSPIR